MMQFPHHFRHKHGHGFTDDFDRVIAEDALRGWIRQEDIARCLGLRSAKTLRRHFREELDRAATEANAQVAQSLYQQPTSGKKTAATIFWLKTRAGWPESPTIEPRPVGIPPLVIMTYDEAA